MYGVGSAIPGEPGDTAFFLPIRLRRLGGNGFVDAASVDRTGYHNPGLSFCFPTPVMAGHIVQHLMECKVHAVDLLPNVKAYWFSLVQLVTVRSIEVAPVAAARCYLWPSPDGGLRN